MVSCVAQIHAQMLQSRSRRHRNPIVRVAQDRHNDMRKVTGQY